ncbi:coiledcoil domain containing [Perkinsus olseni]|uniref:Coiledcoil domain containing n=1 Tax=Perkinsus olseni TaxID=32597 RepID=A0A7J6MDQ2_PEROL|nr:coiledcoil domain containing [Perkinsus olseni]
MPAPPRGSSASSYLQLLHRDIEVTTRKLELERRRLGKLFEDFSRARAEFDDKVLPSKKQKTEQDIYREKAMANDTSPGSSGYNTRVKEILQSCSPGAMRSLESRISKSTAKLNTMNDNVKSITASLSEVSAAFESDRKATADCQRKLSELTAAKDSEKRAFREEVRDIKKQITDSSRESHEWEIQNSRDVLRQRPSVNPSDSQGDRRSVVRFASSSARETMLTGYTSASEEGTFSEMNTMKRILKLAFLNSIQRRHIRQHKRNSEVFEEAFRTIKQATGITEVAEIVRIFVKLEEQNFGLATYSNTLSQDIEGWVKENGKLKKALGMHHARVAGDIQKRQRALAGLSRDIDEKKEGAQSNSKALGNILTVVIDKALSTAREIAKALHKESLSVEVSAIHLASRRISSHGRQGRESHRMLTRESTIGEKLSCTIVFGCIPSTSGDGDLLLKYLDYIERSLSRWADAIPNSGMPAGERPFGYMLAVPMSARSSPPSARSGIAREGTPLVRTGELPVARLTRPAIQAPALAQRRKSGSTVRSDYSSSDEDKIANLDRPCSLTDLRKKAKASIERRRQRRREKKVSYFTEASMDSAASHSLGYDEFVAPMTSADKSVTQDVPPMTSTRAFLAMEREEIPADEIEKLFLSRYMSPAELTDKAEEMKISLNNLCHLKRVFDKYDADRSGSIEFDELKRLLVALGEELTEEEIGMARAGLDADKSGKVEFFDFVKWFASLKVDDVDAEGESSSSDIS